jgi:hypothetical protein
MKESAQHAKSHRSILDPPAMSVAGIAELMIPRPVKRV